VIEPRKGRQRSLVTNAAVLRTLLSPLRGSANLVNHYPRLAEPRPGLNSDRCSAAGLRCVTPLLLATACGIAE